MDFPNWSNLDRTEKKEIFRAVQAGDKASAEYADSTAKVAGWLSRIVKPLAWGASILAAVLLVLFWFITFDRTFWLAYTIGWILIAAALQFVLRRTSRAYRLNRNLSNNDNPDIQDESRRGGLQA